MKLLILDGNSVINRAYFGVKPLTNRDGLYTHAVFGFLNILQRLLGFFHCIVFVNGKMGGHCFRHLIQCGIKRMQHLVAVLKHHGDVFSSDLARLIAFKPQ